MVPSALGQLLARLSTPLPPEKYTAQHGEEVDEQTLVNAALSYAEELRVKGKHPEWEECLTEAEKRLGRAPTPTPAVVPMTSPTKHTTQPRDATIEKYNQKLAATAIDYATAEASKGHSVTWCQAEKYAQSQLPPRPQSLQELDEQLIDELACVEHDRARARGQRLTFTECTARARRELAEAGY